MIKVVKFCSTET